MFNTLLAFSILIFESINNVKFLEWLKSNSQSVAIITLLSGSDVSGLLLLSSNFAGFKLFSVKFSSKAKHYIYLGTICNLFIEDIPQLLIQVCNLFIKKICSIY